MSIEQTNSFIAESLAYADELEKKGHIFSIEILQSPMYAKSVRKIDGKLAITGGSAVVIEKVLIPIVTLEAESIEHATELVSDHPALEKSATFEIRRVDDLNEMREGINK